MSFEFKNADHLYFYCRKALINKDIDFDGMSVDLNNRLNNMTDDFYVLEEDFKQDIFERSIRKPVGQLTWIIRTHKNHNFRSLMDELTNLYGKFVQMITDLPYEYVMDPDVRKGNKDIFVDRDVTDFLYLDVEEIEGRRTCEHFQKDMKKVRRMPGVYFLYNNKKTIIYIGKSNTLGERIPSSIRERKAFRYSYAITETASDAGVYEMYFIAKFKPKLNTDGKYPDKTTIELPELELTDIEKVFERKKVR